MWVMRLQLYNELIWLSGPSRYCLPNMGPSPCNNQLLGEVLWGKLFLERVDYWDSMQWL